jgi:hypothetical protein
VLHLGGSTYVTAEGEVLFALPEGVPAYPLPGGFKVEPSRLAAALKTMVDPDIAVEDRLAEWVAAGETREAAKALFKVIEVATIIGGVLLSVSQPAGLVAAVIAGVVLSAFAGDEEDEGFNAATTNALNVLKAHATIAEADALLAMRAEIQGRLEDLLGKRSDLETHEPTGAARLNLFSEMRDILDSLSVAVVRIRDEDWLGAYNPDAYKARVGLSSVLEHYRTDGTLESVPPQPPSLAAFDYRLGVPMLLYTGLTYSTMLRMAIPWFRSTGSFRERLRLLARSIDAFVLKMQAESLAWTEHTSQSLYKHEVFPPSLYFGSPFGLGFGSGVGLTRTYPTGAFDLTRYSDSYIFQKYAAALSSGDTGALGTFDYTWEPPASLTDPVGHLIDYQRGAAAANDQARDDYAQLVVASGAVHLLLASATLRHLSSPPTESETVRGRAEASRTAVADTPATAVSPVIFPNRQVTASATLRTYKARARLRLSTQEPGHEPALRYRVLLRTIDSKFGAEGWRSDGYLGRVWRSELEPIPGDAQNKRLRTDYATEFVLDEVLLYEGVSPPSAIVRESPRPAILKAHTFDWYVPVVAPWAAELEELPTWAAHSDAAAAGSRSMHLTQAESMVSGIASQVVRAQAQPVLTKRSYGQLTYSALVPSTSVLDDIGAAFTDIDTASAERRHVKLEDVTLNWSLHWQDGLVEVKLTGRPTDRSCQVYVVVEEAVQAGEDGPEKWLHTPVAAELVNQTMLVPESFFKEEGEAISAARALWYDLIDRFSEVAEVGPLDPVAQAMSEAGNMLAQSSSTSSLASAIELQFEAVRQQRPEVWAQAMRDHDVASPA